MKEHTAPYGFVPLAEKVVEPDWIRPRRGSGPGGGWVAPPVQDVPFPDGICGTLELTVTAETPIFTRGVEGKGERFFEIPGVGPALPGTALRGALRNVVEIASFGRMDGRVNDHRYSVRDLQNRELYGNYMADIVRDTRTGKREPMPLVNAGWLRKKGRGDEARYEIEVCDFAKIEYLLLEELSRKAHVKKFQPGRKQSAVKKYKDWGSASREVTVQASFQRPDRVNGRAMPSRYGKVRGLHGALKGTLVFTGQPSRWTPDRSGGRRRGNAKHHDFVFFRRERREVLPVEPEVFKDFEFAHSDRGQQHRLGKAETPNEEWGYWKERLERGEPVPVFFLAGDDGRSVRSFGLAMMFRLPYRHSIGEAVRHAQPAEYDGDRPRLDLADGLFGTVRKPEGAKASRRDAFALKGRVFVSHAVAQGAPQSSKRVETILSGPRASYYPNYVEQDPSAPGADAARDFNGRPRYVTWQDEGCRPRGWKRYHVMTETWRPEVPTGGDGRPVSLEKVGTRFRPLPAGTVFRGALVVHNVKPEELGALLWALDFGGDGEARHALGMARPLGYGRCSIAVKARDDLRRVDGEAVDLEACRAAFERYMESQVPGWRESHQIRELLALARPVPPDQAEYQRLDPGRRLNEFVDAKKQGTALPSASAGRHPSTRRSPTRGGDRRGAPRDPRGRGGRSGRGRRDDRPQAPPPRTARGVSAARKAWPGKKRGDVLRVKLTVQNKKGKWRSEVVGHDAKGTIEGTPPPDAAAGKVYEVEVIQGSDPRNLNLKWKE